MYSLFWSLVFDNCKLFCPSECYSVWGDKAGAFWSMMSFIILLISLFLIYNQINVQNNSNKLNFIISFDQKWWSEEYIKLRNKVCSKTNNSIDPEDERILSFFEDLGIMHKKKVIDLQLIWDKFSYYIENYWKILNPAVKKYQKDMNDLTWFQYFEELQYKVFEYSRKQSQDKNYDISQIDLQKFIDSEKMIGKDN